MIYNAIKTSGCKRDVVPPKNGAADSKACGWMLRAPA
jgi:hypothetical protein